jgi:hypothetical protein
MTAGFYDDDFSRQFWKNQEAYRNLQRMINQTMAPAMEAIRQSEAITALQKQMAAAVLPAIDHSAFNAMRSFAKMMPVIDVPKMPLLTFRDITKFKLGDDVVQKFVDSIDVDELTKSAAPPVEHEPTTTPRPQDNAPVSPPKIDLKNFKEEDLDRYADLLYLAQPLLPQALENDPELSKLDNYQRKVFVWLLSLLVMCGMSVLHTWGTYDETVASITAVAEQIDSGILGSDDITKVVFPKEEDNELLQEREDEPEDA